VVQSLRKSFVLVSVLILIMSFYSIAGVEWFATNEDIGESHFGTYGRAMYSLLQVITGDSWSSIIARTIMQEEPVFGGIYFVSYTIVVGN
jgi:hypothetical protein